MLLAQRPLWSVVMRKRRDLTDSCLNYGKQKKVVSLFLFFLVALIAPATGSIWVHLSQSRHSGGPRCPLRLQGISMLQCGSLLLWKKELTLPTALSGPSQSSNPAPHLLYPSKMPWSTETVGLHVHRETENRLTQQIEKMPLLNIGVTRLSAQVESTFFLKKKKEPSLQVETTETQKSSQLPSAFQPMLNVRAGYQAVRLNGSRASLASYFKSLRSYSNTQLLWCKQRPLVTHYYSYGVYKSATLM